MQTVTMPLDTAERLMDLAGQRRGLTDTPTLTLFAEVRLLIEQARKKR